MHPYPTINRLDRSYAWLDEHEPQCAEIVRDHDDLVEDFLGLNHYPHGAARVYSNERWALTGEAGVTTVSPAIRNAIYAATGIALRRLPIDREVLAGRKPA